MARHGCNLTTSTDTDNWEMHTSKANRLHVEKDREGNIQWEGGRVGLVRDMPDRVSSLAKAGTDIVTLVSAQSQGA